METYSQYVVFIVGIILNSSLILPILGRTKEAKLKEQEYQSDFYLLKEVSEKLKPEPCLQVHVNISSVHCETSCSEKGEKIEINCPIGVCCNLRDCKDGTTLESMQVPNGTICTCLYHELNCTGVHFVLRSFKDAENFFNAGWKDSNVTKQQPKRTSSVKKGCKCEEKKGSELTYEESVPNVRQNLSDCINSRNEALKDRDYYYAALITVSVCSAVIIPCLMISVIYLVCDKRSDTI